MSTLPELVNTHLPAARTRYAAAVDELLAAFGNLHGLERFLEAKTSVSVGFGDMPELVKLRHRDANPGLKGNWGDLSQSGWASRAAAFGVPD